MALNTTHASVIISSRTDGFARAHRPTTRTKINRMTTLPHQPAGRSTATWYSMVEEDDASEPLPTELNTIDHPRFLAVSKDKLTVRYVGRGNHSQDVGAVRTEWPCPQRCLVYYFEVTVADSGTRGSIAVGLADKHFQLNRQPGWEPNSYACACSPPPLFESHPELTFSRLEIYFPIQTTATTAAATSTPSAASSTARASVRATSSAAGCSPTAARSSSPRTARTWASPSRISAAWSTRPSACTAPVRRCPST